MPHELPREATLTIRDPWGEPIHQPVLVVGETTTHYRIRAVVRTQIEGYDSWLSRDQDALAPRRAITF